MQNTHQFSKNPSMEDDDTSTNSQSSNNDNKNGKLIISHSSWALALNDSESFYNTNIRNEEKIYEDLCYVTFSSTFTEVNNNDIFR